jgi:hypothetical protein
MNISNQSGFDISDTEDDFNLDAFLNSNLTDLVKKPVSQDDDVIRKNILASNSDRLKSNRDEVIFR